MAHCALIAEIVHALAVSASEPAPEQPCGSLFVAIG